MREVCGGWGSGGGGGWGGGGQLTEESKLPGESFRHSRLQKVGR